MRSTPLPPSVPSRVEHRGHILSAYNMLLRLEKTVLADIDSAAKKSEKEEAELSLMYCRIVGHFFHHVPSDEGLKYLTHEVSSTGGDQQQLLDIGKLYFNHALRLFRSNKGCTPTESHHPSRPSFNHVADLIKAKLEEAPQSHKTAKNRALVRDKFRCLISGAYDVKSTNESAELMQEALERSAPFASTACAHIFSESTNVGISGGSSKGDYAASAWTILSRFSGRGELLLQELNGARVHRLENVMTLDPTVHFLFDNLNLWLEPTQPPGAEDEYKNTYKVAGTNPGHLRMYPAVVEFTTTDPINLPLPSREYLELHAACAKVSHLSAAAEYMDSILRDMEEIPVLSKDGSSAAVLEHAIWAAQRKLVYV